MYKVFVNDKVVILTDRHDLELVQNSMLYFQYDDFEEIHFVLKLLAESENLMGMIIFSEELEILWADFRAHFKEIEAGGGLVNNSKGEILLIKRLEKWDLPKGKREKDEDLASCAIREVKEECGLKHLELGEKLLDTYHTYHLEGMDMLKCTTWYGMMSDDKELIPQTSENIEVAKWMSRADLDWDNMPTYSNILLVINHKDGSTGQS